MGVSFRDSLDHLLAELQRIELKLQLQVMKSRVLDTRKGEDSNYGLYLSEKEIDTVLGTSPFQQGDNSSLPDNSDYVTRAESLKQLEATIDEETKEST